MKLGHWLVAAAAAALALPASAVVKVYDSTPPHGTPGDEFQFSTTLCPPISVTPGAQQGSYRLNDTGGGTVTVVEIDMQRVTRVDFDATATFGPGAYVFVDAVSFISASPGQTAPGSTAPTGTVDWGILGGWANTGVGFCVASPQTICTAGAQLPHGATTRLSPITSPTFDLGTWTFDAGGDFQAASNYVWGTFNGGLSNRQSLLRGAFVGGSVPALPLVGVGALALGLLAAGARAGLRKK
ncbi:MAG: hypothetical protein R3E88_04830 [Myxococcota bacterium]